jgi:type I restriction enzyme S subunit
MTPAELIAAFEALAEAPAGVSLLRELILQLALRGKLVPQDPRDAPVSALLVRLEEGCSSKNTQAMTELPRSRHPWGIPKSWAWTRTVDLGELSPRNDCPDTRVVAFCPMPTIPTEIRDSVRPERREWGQIKKGYTHFTNGDVVVAKITPCFQNGKSCVMQEAGAGTTELHVVRPNTELVNSRYLLLFYKSPFFLRGGVAQMTGTAGQQRVPREYFGNAPLPIPPLAEQHRIVARVDELMGLLDSLDAARSKREATRAAARDSVLAAIREADSPEAVDSAWTRFAQRMDDLLCDPADIAPLRQTVLQLAVRGRLVRQDPKDEPASELLERIAAEKKRLVVEGKISKPKSLQPVLKDEVPFDEAEGWAWARLDRVAATVTDGDHLPPPQASSGVAFLTIGNISSGRLDFSDTRFVSETYYNGLDDHRRPRNGDLLYTVVGATYGRPVPVNKEPPFCVQRHIAIIRPLLVDRDYLCVFLKSPCAYQQATAAKTGSAQPTVALGPLRRFCVPVPPLAEQRRIVARVDELTGLLDRIEQRLAATKATQAAFASAAVHHVVA